MNLITLAWRNLLRNRRRSLLAVISTFLATMLITMGNGLTEGFLASMVRNYAKNETGHVHITTLAYRQRSRFMPIDEYIENLSELLHQLESPAATQQGIPTQHQGQVVTVAPRIRFGVLLSSGTYTKPAVAIAGDPERERELLMLNTSLLPGSSYLDDPGSVIIGERLAKDLHLGLGDRLRLISTRADGGMAFKSLRITGIFRTGTNALDGSVFQMRLDDAQSMLGMEGGAQQVLVMLRDYRHAQAEAARIDQMLKASGRDDLSVLPWTRIGDYPAIIQMANSVYLIMWFFVALLGAFIIANIMTMVVLERRRETGILMSMGMPQRAIIGMFLLEGTALGFGGSVLGTLAGTVFNLAFSRKGFDFSSGLAGFTWPIDNIIRPVISPAGVLIGLCMCTLATMLMSFMPALRASNMEPVEAIKAVE